MSQLHQNTISASKVDLKCGSKKYDKNKNPLFLKNWVVISSEVDKIGVTVGLSIMCKFQYGILHSKFLIMHTVI